MNQSKTFIKGYKESKKAKNVFGKFAKAKYFLSFFFFFFLL